jgi:uncharacterized protein (DUF4415 family)
MYFCTYSCLVPRLRRSGKAPPPPAAARKTRITIRLDDDVLAWFRRHAGVSGGGYQSLINLALRDHIGREGLATTLRRVIREELARAEGQPSAPAYESDHPPIEWVADAGDPGEEYGASSKPGRRRGHGRRRKD